MSDIGILGIEFVQQRPPVLLMGWLGWLPFQVSTHPIDITRITTPLQAQVERASGAPKLQEQTAAPQRSMTSVPPRTLKVSDSAMTRQGLETRSLLYGLNETEEITVMHRAGTAST